MIQPPEPPAAPPPQGFPVRPRPRVSRRAIAVGVVLELVLSLIAAVAVGVLVQSSSPSVALGVKITAGVSLAAFATGLGLALGGRTPAQRGLGAGMLLGWALWFIVGAGLCVALVVSSLGSGGSAPASPVATAPVSAP